MPSPGEAVGPAQIDLRPLFAPASIAVVGASPRGTIAQTVRDNLRVMGSATRIHFVNPNYAEVDGTPCHPSLDALPERPDTVLLAVNPLRSARFMQDAADAPRIEAHHQHSLLPVGPDRDRDVRRQREDLRFQANRRCRFG